METIIWLRRISAAGIAKSLNGDQALELATMMVEFEKDLKHAFRKSFSDEDWPEVAKKMKYVI